MMTNYKEKNELMTEWDRQISSHGRKLLDPGSPWMSQFTLVTNNYTECARAQAAHAALVCAVFRGRAVVCLFYLFCLVSGCHTIGWVLNSTSMESVPFERLLTFMN